MALDKHDKMEEGDRMKIVTIIGARPQFIKASVVSRAIEEDPDGAIKEVLLHTGQHYDENMSKVFFNELGIKEPEYNLAIGSGPHGAQTGRMLGAIEEVLIKEAPDCVLVYGDTNSTLAGALAAKKLGIKVAHVEAGLRSFKMSMPEEINRVMTDRISDILFCPTEAAVKNLECEGFSNILKNGALIDGGHVNMSPLPIVANIGDVMLDASLNFRKLAKERSTIIGTLGLKEKDYVLATIHRAENTDNGEHLKEIINGFLDIAKETTVVFSLHPRTEKALKREGLKEALNASNGIILTGPLPYLDMVSLEERAAAIITDSGGVQKEAFFYKVPCITVRDETEWVETVESGSNTLTGANAIKIKEAFKEATGTWQASAQTFYGDGTAGNKVITCLKAIR